MDLAFHEKPERYVNTHPSFPPGYAAFGLLDLTVRSPSLVNLCDKKILIFAFREKSVTTIINVFMKL